MAEIDYKVFCKMCDIKEVKRYDETRMGIVLAPRAMTRGGIVYTIGDKLVKGGKVGYIIHFAGYNDDYLGAIVRFVVSKDVVWCKLEEDEQIDKLAYKLMNEYGLVMTSDGYCRKAIAIDLYEKDGNTVADVYREAKSRDEFICIHEAIGVDRLEKFLISTEAKDTWGRYKKHIL